MINGKKISESTEDGVSGNQHELYDTIQSRVIRLSRNFLRPIQKSPLKGTF